MITKVALIPARSGSARISNKNVYALNNHPLIAYSIRSAIDSNIFDNVICATDSSEYAEIARYYGAEVPILRPKSISGDRSPDIEWITWMLNYLKSQGRSFDIFSILRPTSPFRSADTIQRAWNTFEEFPEADSLRAVEKCSQHPGKMWTIHGNRILPIMPFKENGIPWHSSQYQSLPEIYVQNASLEIAWTRVALEHNSIAGTSIVPFITEGFEGYDINLPEDLWFAEGMLEKGLFQLPSISLRPYQ